MPPRVVDPTTPSHDRQQKLLGLDDDDDADDGGHRRDRDHERNDNDRSDDDPHDVRRDVWRGNRR